MARDDDIFDEGLKIRKRVLPTLRETPAVMAYPGSISGRIRANPLKLLAYLLREKLMATQGGPCNLLQVATEIHTQAKDKHNTTLRRIYDVVNVCEGAGVLARTVHRGLKPNKQTAVDQDVTRTCFPFRRTGKRSLRGCAGIQWIGRPSFDTLGENDDTPHTPSETEKCLLQRERTEIVDRIIQKQMVSDTLSNQVAALQKLLDQNQAHCSFYRNSLDSKSKTGAYFPSNLCKPSTIMRRSNPGAAPYDTKVELRKITPARGVYTELDSLQSLEDSLCDAADWNFGYFEHQNQRRIAKRLYLPFVMLATNPDANVEIFMTGEPPHAVQLQLDSEYVLMDHIQMIKMLPGTARP